MVEVILRMMGRPHRAAQMLQALRSLMLPLEAAPGFVSCHLYTGVGLPDSLCCIEQWHTTEDLDQQIRPSRYTRLPALVEEAAKPPDLRLNWIQDVKGRECLEAVRLRADWPPERAAAQDLVTLYRALGGGWQLREGADPAPVGVKDQVRRRAYGSGMINNGRRVPHTQPAGGV